MKSITMEEFQKEITEAERGISKILNPLAEKGMVRDMEVKLTIDYEYNAEKSEAKGDDVFDADIKTRIKITI